MVLGQNMRVVGAFKNCQDTQEALSQLLVSGFPKEKVSVGQVKEVAAKADGTKAVDASQVTIAP